MFSIKVIIILMKKLKLKEVYDVFVDSTNTLATNLQMKLDEIKIEYQQNIIEEKIKLLLLICKNENLNFDNIKTKYLKQKELNHIHTQTSDNSSTEEAIMNTIEMNGTKYYYEVKDDGNVYDMDSNQVGTYKNGKIILY
jgi:hypothetical protein